jgi:hypothetical protein
MRRAMEEEHSKDLAALERLQRFLPSADESRSNNVKQAEAVPPQRVIVTDEQEPESSGHPTLISAVLTVLQSNPGSSMTGRHILAALESKGFPMVGDERRRLTSIGQALSKLADREPAPIRVVRHGKGKEPNFYRALVTTTNPAHITTGAPGEMTM